MTAKLCQKQALYETSNEYWTKMDEEKGGVMFEQASARSHTAKPAKLGRWFARETQPFRFFFSPSPPMTLHLKCLA